MSTRLYAWGYRVIQRALHALNLHYMPATYPDGDVVLWCRWCGARSKVVKSGGRVI